MPIRILLADDNEILRDSLRRMLESEPDLTIVGEAADGAEAVELAERQRPDVAILDIGMKRMNGLEAASRISSLCPRTAVLMLTVYSGEAYVARAIQAGARGYVLKDSIDSEDLARAIRTLHNGGRFFGTSIVKQSSAATQGPF